jgi:putative Ca2+/H+ antiporter (TMEM165/GDT1 family)
MAMAFATRYRPWTVLAAVSIATLLVHAGSVLIGATVALALPTAAIQIAAGLAFFASHSGRCAATNWRDDEGRARRTGKWAC